MTPAATAQSQSRVVTRDQRRDMAGQPVTSSGRIDSLDLVRGLVWC